MNEPVDIVMTTFNRLKYLKIAIETIKARTTYPYRLIIVDSGSIDGTQQWLVEAKSLGIIDTCVLLSENRGMAYAMVQGSDFVNSEYFIFTQDDALPPELSPCWLTQMADLFKRNEQEVYAISMPVKRKLMKHGN